MESQLDRWRVSWIDEKVGWKIESWLEDRKMSVIDRKLVGQI